MRTMANENRPYRGIWPVVPTPFTEEGALDLEGQKRVLDCMIDQGVDGMCILANYSEQFLLSDDERDVLTRLCLEHVGDRVPVIVTCSHFATQIVVDRARQAKELGAKMIMLMPPYHGATLKGSADGIVEQFARAAEAGLPIMVQDAPLSGVELGVELLARLAREIDQVRYFKIETPMAAAKLRALIKAGGDLIEGPFDGEEGITLLADLDAGATGSMTSALLPDKIKPVLSHHFAGDRTAAAAQYANVLPLINHENRQCGLRACKSVMMEGGVIKSERVRHPMPQLAAETRAELITLARGLDVLALKWGK
jgi:2-keto-3-deoxy-L-arabinonate dehydratase